MVRLGVTFFLTLSWITGTCFGVEFEVEDLVFVIRDADVKVDDKVVDRVKSGTCLYVEDVNGDWLWVDSRVPGWLDKANVVLVDDAIPYANDAIRRNPTSDAYVSRAIVWTNLSEDDAAIRDFTEAIRLDPKNAEWYVRRGHLRGRTKDFDQAFADFDVALKMEPRSSEVYVARGNVRLMKGEPDLAIADHNDALKLNPKSTFAYTSRGRAWEDKGELDKALADYDEALRIDPMNDAASLYRIRAKLKKERASK